VFIFLNACYVLGKGTYRVTGSDAFSKHSKTYQKPQVRQGRIERKLQVTALA
jgi:hypothetical protein